MVASALRPAHSSSERVTVAPASVSAATAPRRTAAPYAAERGSPHRRRCTGRCGVRWLPRGAEPSRRCTVSSPRPPGAVPVGARSGRTSEGARRTPHHRFSHMCSTRTFIVRGRQVDGGTRGRTSGSIGLPSRFRRKPGIESGRTSDTGHPRTGPHARLGTVTPSMSRREPGGCGFRRAPSCLSNDPGGCPPRHRALAARAGHRSLPFVTYVS